MDELQPSECPLCRRIASGEVLRRSPDDLAVAFRDAFPLAEGHTLVVPRRHEPDLLGLTREESAALWALAMDLAAEVKAGFGAGGLTLGVNAGEAAGQTVAHVHVHIVPRRTGDVPEPRGGIRWVIPERAAYWETSAHDREEDA
jgi:diadenosine tetraphosphate (Ap4A) HIT family hydrolase